MVGLGMDACGEPDRWILSEKTEVEQDGTYMILKGS